MRVPAKPEGILEIYVDESSQNTHRYLVLGAVVVQLTNSKIINDLIAKARLPELPFNEIKWTKVSKAKLAAYTRVVDVLFYVLTNCTFIRYSLTQPNRTTRSSIREIAR
jgi:hypothetical protein